MKKKSDYSLRDLWDNSNQKGGGEAGKKEKKAYGKKKCLKIFLSWGKEQASRSRKLKKYKSKETHTEAHYKEIFKLKVKQ